MPGLGGGGGGSWKGEESPDRGGGDPDVGGYWLLSAYVWPGNKSNTTNLSATDNHKSLYL